MFLRSFALPQWKTRAGQHQSYDMEGGETVSCWINVGATHSFMELHSGGVDRETPASSETAGAWEARSGPGNLDQKEVIISRIPALWCCKSVLCLSWGSISLNAGLFVTSWLDHPLLPGQAFPVRRRMPKGFHFLSPKCRDTWAFPGYIVLQNTAFVYDLHLEFGTLQTFWVAFVRKTSWRNRGIQIFWTQFQKILIRGGSSVSSGGDFESPCRSWWHSHRRTPSCPCVVDVTMASSLVLVCTLTWLRNR